MPRTENYLLALLYKVNDYAVKSLHFLLTSKDTVIGMLIML